MSVGVVPRSHMAMTLTVVRFPERIEPLELDDARALFETGRRDRALQILDQLLDSLPACALREQVAALHRKARNGQCGNEER